MTRKLRTRLRRAIGLGLALGVVIAPNALAKPYIEPGSVLNPSATTALAGSNPAANSYSFYRPAVANQTAVKVTTANGYSFYRPAVASAIAMKHTTYNGSSFYRPAPAKVTYYDAWHVPAITSAGAASIALTHDTWGRDIRAARVGSVRPVSGTTFHDSWGKDARTATQSTSVSSSSGSNDTRNILLAASAAGLLLIGGGSLVLMLRRRRPAQLA